jgi:hypothetical protein
VLVCLSACLLLFIVQKIKEKMSNWQEDMRLQQKNLEQLKAADAALNQDQIAADIDKILTHKFHHNSRNASGHKTNRLASPLALDRDRNIEESEIPTGRKGSLNSMGSPAAPSYNGLPSPPGGGVLQEITAETADR